MFFKKQKKKKKEPKKLTREELIAQATANAAKARAEIGDETLQKIAEAMQRKENSATEQAKRKIRAMDDGKVADHLKIIIEDK